MLKQAKMRATTMSTHRDFVFMVCGTIVTIISGMLTNLWAGMAPILGFITRSDISFYTGEAVGTVTFIAACVRCAKDWKEGKMRLPFIGRRKNRKG